MGTVCFAKENALRALYLAGTQAAGTDIDVGGGTVHDCLNSTNVGLPGTVGTDVGMGDLDAEGNALVADFTLSH